MIDPVQVPEEPAPPQPFPIQMLRGDAPGFEENASGLVNCTDPIDVVPTTEDAPFGQK